MTNSEKVLEVWKELKTKLTKALKPYSIRLEQLSGLKELRSNLTIKQQQWGLLLSNKEFFKEVLESEISSKRQKLLTLPEGGSLKKETEERIKTSKELLNKLNYLTEPIDNRYHEDFLPRLLVILDMVLRGGCES